MHDAVFGVAAARHQRAHLIADIEAFRSFAQRDDFSGNFQARNLGRAGRRRVKSAPLQNIRTIDASRFNSDKNAFTPRLGNGMESQ